MALAALPVRPGVPGDQERYEKDILDKETNPGKWGDTRLQAQLDSEAKIEKKDRKVATPPRKTAPAPRQKGKR